MKIKHVLFMMLALLMSCFMLAGCGRSSDENSVVIYSSDEDYINAHFHWDQESNTYQQFIVTLHRRFG